MEHSLAELQRDFGVRSVDVVVATHYHDDHVAGFGYLKERFGTEVWALDVFADVLERPWAYRLPAVWSEPVAVDRRFAAGETIEWEGHSFEARHLPGHTWYAGGLFGQVDGRRVAIIGDEIQLDGDGVLRGGGPVYRNRFRLDSFRRGIDAVRAFEPEVLLTGHDGAIDVDRASLDGVREWAVELEEALVALVPDDLPVGLALDPAFAAFHPYQLRPRAGESFEAAVEVVNHGDESAEAHVRLVLPPGWRAAPEEHFDDARERRDLLGAVHGGRPRGNGPRTPVSARGRRHAGRRSIRAGLRGHRRVRPREANHLTALHPRVMQSFTQ